MAITVARTSTDLIGSAASPASISAGATTTSTALDHTTGGVTCAVIGLRLIMGATAPTSAITIRYQYSLDGTNYLQDGADISLTGANATTYDMPPYCPPDPSAKSRAVVINGAGNAITAWCQGGTLAVS